MIIYKVIPSFHKKLKLDRLPGIKSHSENEPTIVWSTTRKELRLYRQKITLFGFVVTYIVLENKPVFRLFHVNNFLSNHRISKFYQLKNLKYKPKYLSMFLF